VRANKRQARVDNCSKRLLRLVHLRSLNSPLWIIKTEQIALVLNSRGLKAPGLAGQYTSKLAEDLYVKYIIPLLNNNFED
jgi:hypothetical protein